MQCDRLMLMVGLSFLTLSRWLPTDERRFMIIPMLCVTIFVILVVWFLLPSFARLMIHTPTAISIFVCLSMVQLMVVFNIMRCTFCGRFLQVALSLIFVVLVGFGLLMLKVSRLKLPVIWLSVSMWLNTLTKSQIWTLLLKV